MPENYSAFYCSADADETYRLNIRKDDGLVTVVAENSRKRDCFSYRREKDGHIVFDRFETGHVMRMLIVMHDAFRFYIGRFLVACNRKDAIALCGGEWKQSLFVTADTNVIIEKEQTLIANTFTIRGARNLTVNGTVNATSIVLEDCRCIKGGIKKDWSHNTYFTENLCLNL